MNLRTLCLFALISSCLGCTQDSIWKLITCGPKATRNLQSIFTSGSYNFCGSDPVTPTTINRDAIVAAFQYCYQNGQYTQCSAKQQEGLDIPTFEAALNAVPCSVVNDASPPPSCADAYLKCIYDTAADIADAAGRGKPCVCKERTLIKSAVLNNCVNTATALSSCSGLSASHKTTIEASKTTLENLLDGVDCTGINTADCDCYDNIKKCISETTPAAGITGGGVTEFMNTEWDLIQTTALNNQGNTQALTWEQDKAWNIYAVCRPMAFPDSYDNAVLCIENQAVVAATCDVSFPETIAYAEHESNTTFFQTVAAAAHNIKDFCHDWCKNTTIWTTVMMTELTSFHPPGWKTGDSADTVVKYIMNQNTASLKAVCDANPTQVKSELDKAGDTIKDCPYLPRHILIADMYSFQHVLVNSDALEAIYKILQSCQNTQNLMSPKEWATTWLAARDNDKKDSGNTGNSGLTGFFGDGTRIAPLDYQLLLLLATFIVLLKRW